MPTASRTSLFSFGRIGQLFSSAMTSIAQALAGPAAPKLQADKRAIMYFAPAGRSFDIVAGADAQMVRYRPLVRGVVHGRPTKAATGQRAVAQQKAKARATPVEVKIANGKGKVPALEAGYYAVEVIGRAGVFESKDWDRYLLVEDTPVLVWRKVGWGDALGRFANTGFGDRFRFLGDALRAEGCVEYERDRPDRAARLDKITTDKERLQRELTTAEGERYGSWGVVAAGAGLVVAGAPVPGAFIAASGIIVSSDRNNTSHSIKAQMNALDDEANELRRKGRLSAEGYCAEVEEERAQKAETEEGGQAPAGAGGNDPHGGSNDNGNANDTDEDDDDDLPDGDEDEDILPDGDEDYEDDEQESDKSESNLPPGLDRDNSDAVIWALMNPDNPAAQAVIKMLLTSMKRISGVYGSRINDPDSFVWALANPDHPIARKMLADLAGSIAVKTGAAVNPSPDDDGNVGVTIDLIDTSVIVNPFGDPDDNPVTGGGLGGDIGGLGGGPKPPVGL